MNAPIQLYIPSASEAISSSSSCRYLGTAACTGYLGTSGTIVVDASLPSFEWRGRPAVRGCVHGLYARAAYIDYIQLYIVRYYMYTKYLAINSRYSTR